MPQLHTYRPPSSTASSMVEATLFDTVLELLERTPHTPMMSVSHVTDLSLEPIKGVLGEVASQLERHENLIVALATKLDGANAEVGVLKDVVKRQEREIETLQQRQQQQEAAAKPAAYPTEDYEHQQRALEGLQSRVTSAEEAVENLLRQQHQLQQQQQQQQQQQSRVAATPSSVPARTPVPAAPSVRPQTQSVQHQQQHQQLQQQHPTPSPSPDLSMVAPANPVFSTPPASARPPPARLPPPKIMPKGPPGTPRAPAPATPHPTTNPLLDHTPVATQAAASSASAAGAAPARASAGFRTDEGSEKGLSITSILPGSAAERAQLEVGDIITRFQTREVRSRLDLLQCLERCSPGDIVDVTVSRAGRGGGPRTVRMMLGQR
eukprot:PhM_4_TR2461/c2_g1_i1/m.15300